MCHCMHHALLAGRRLDVEVRLDRYGEAFLFCLDCAREVGDVLTAEEGTPDYDVAIVWYEKRVQDECFKCVEDRLKAVGLPSVRELLETERARLSQIAPGTRPIPSHPERG